MTEDSHTFIDLHNMEDDIDSDDDNRTTTDSDIGELPHSNTDVGLGTTTRSDIFVLRHSKSAPPQFYPEEVTEYDLTEETPRSRVQFNDRASMLSASGSVSHPP